MKNSSADPHDKKDTVPSKDADPSVPTLVIIAAVLALTMLRYIWTPLAEVAWEVFAMLIMMVVVLVLLVWRLSRYEEEGEEPPVKKMDQVKGPVKDEKKGEEPPVKKKHRKGFSNVLFLLVFAAFLALALLQYTWEPLAGVAPEVLPLLFVMAVVLIGFLTKCATELSGLVKSAVHSDSKKDLQAGIVDMRATLELRIAKNSRADKNLMSNCEALLVDAEKFCKEGLTNVGWRAVVQARLLSLYLLAQGDKEIQNGAQVTLSRSAVELDSWRRAAVKSILEDPAKSGKLKDNVAVHELYDANWVLEEYTNERYDSLDRSAWQLYILSAVALASIVVLAFALPSLSTSEPLLLLDDRLLIPVIILVGALGGATGGFFSVLRWFKTKQAIAHEQTMSSWMIAIRPLIGAVFALAVSLFLFSGFLNLGEVSLELLLSICFVAGFSEHFVIDIVNRIVQEGTPAKDTSTSVKEEYIVNRIVQEGTPGKETPENVNVQPGGPGTTASGNPPSSVDLQQSSDSSRESSTPESKDEPKK